MVQPAAAVRGFPVGGAIAPPAVDFLIRRNEVAGHIGPVEGGLRFAQQPGLDRGVADNVEKLLVAPHVIFQRRDIEIAHQDHRIALLRRAAGEELFHGLQEVQLVGELLVLLRIGNVAAGRDIEIVAASRHWPGSRPCGGHGPRGRNPAPRSRERGFSRAPPPRDRPSGRGSPGGHSPACGKRRPETARSGPWFPAGRPHPAVRPAGSGRPVSAGIAPN